MANAPTDPRDRRIRELEKENARLQAENTDLRKRVDELESKVEKIFGRRPSSPPADEQKKPPLACQAKPKSRPIGRPPGHQGAFRLRPQHADRTETVPLDHCPDCGTRVEETKPREHFVQEFERPPVQTVRYVTQTGYCPQCKKRVESRAPEQLTTASGAAGVTLGPVALAWAASLKYGAAVPFEKVAAIFRFWNMPITAGGLALAMQRMARGLTPFYEAAQSAIQRSESVWGDETGWKILGKKAWLWVFTAVGVAYYTIIRSRGSKVVHATLGPYFRGALHCDFWSAYFDIECPKQRCVAHLLRELHKWADPNKDPPLSYRRFHRRACRLFRNALAYKQEAEKHGWSARKRAECVQRLHRRLKRVLRPTYSDHEAERIANRLFKYRDELFLFIERPDVEGTNNRAERAIRPAVVGRKVAGGCRSDAGAQAYAVLTSLVETCRLRGIDFVETCAGLLRASVNGRSHRLLDELCGAPL